mgnify:FL=1
MSKARDLANLLNAQGRVSGASYTDNDTTYSVTDGELSENNFTDEDHNKLQGIEVGATRDQSKSEIDALNIDADKLDGQHATYFTQYADDAVADLVSSAPSTLNTLNELADALGDDPNFATTITNGLANKVDNSQVLTNVPSGAIFTDTVPTLSSLGYTGATNANNYSHPTGSGNKHIPSGGSSGKILTYSSSGTATWQDPEGGGLSAGFTGAATGTGNITVAGTYLLILDGYGNSSDRAWGVGMSGTNLTGAFGSCIAYNGTITGGIAGGRSGNEPKTVTGIISCTNCTFSYTRTNSVVRWVRVG